MTLNCPSMAECFGCRNGANSTQPSTDFRNSREPKPLTECREIRRKVSTFFTVLKLRISSAIGFT